jgi:hypothetical protein
MMAGAKVTHTVTQGLGAFKFVTRFFVGDWRSCQMSRFSQNLMNGEIMKTRRIFIPIWI